MLSMLLAAVNLITCDLASTISDTGKRDSLLLRITPKEIKMLRPILEVSVKEYFLHNFRFLRSLQSLPGVWPWTRVLLQVALCMIDLICYSIPTTNNFSFPSGDYCCRPLQCLLRHRALCLLGDDQQGVDGLRLHCWCHLLDRPLRQVSTRKNPS